MFLKFAKAVSLTAGVVRRVGVGLAVCAAFWPAAAQAQVTVSSIDVPSSIGRELTATIAIQYARSSAAGATLTVPLPAQLEVNPPVLPAGCVLTAGPAVACAVPPGGPGATGVVKFDVRGQAIGAFNLTATATGGSSATNPGSVQPSGDLTVAKTRTSPPGTPVSGQSITFRLSPNVAAGGDVIPFGAQVTLTDTLPGPASDFLVTSIVVPPGGAVTCNSPAAATAARQVSCTFKGPLTLVEFNALTIDITGSSASNGNFVNNAGIATSLVSTEPYVDRNNANNTASLPYAVNPGSDLQAQGAFPLNSLVNTTQTLSLVYRNNGPTNVPAGGTVAAQIPAGFTPGALPAGCVFAAPEVRCTASAVLNGGTQSFPIPLLTPASSVAGNITVTVAPPPGLGDGNPSNDTVLLAYSVLPPTGDLGIAKFKTPGPLEAGSSITSSITVTNADISPIAYTAGGGVQPLRVVDDMDNKELFVSASPGWTCVDGGPDSAGAGRRRVSCVRDAAGTLAPGASVVLQLNTRADPGIAGPIDLGNMACTGKSVLSLLGLADTNGPQPYDHNTANDCQSRSVTATNVISGQAVVNVTKDASNDKATWVHAPAVAPVIDGNNDFAYWRIMIATPSGGVQQTIPSLNLTDNLPGILNLAANGPTPAHVTPPVTITTQITGGAGGACPATLPAGSSNLTCTFTNVAPGSTITLVISMKRPFQGGLLDNTAKVTSGNAILTGTVTGQATLNVMPRVDPAVSSKTIAPLNSATAPRVGQTMSFPITARNHGVDAMPAGSFLITDTLAPAKYGNLSATGANMSCATTVATGLVSCSNTNTVNRAAARTVVITAYLLKPAVLPGSNPVSSEINTATVSATGGMCEWKDETGSSAAVSTACNDGIAASNNAGTVGFDIKLPMIDLQQRKTRELPAGQSAFGYGDALSYRMRIQNLGPSRAENVVMTDYLAIAAGFTVGTVTVSDINGVAPEGGFSLDGSKAASVSCSLSGAAEIRCLLDSTLAKNFQDAGREVNFRLGIQYSGPSNAVNTFGNQAVVCADETGSFESVGACSRDTSAGPTGTNNNTASANDLVFPKADLGIAKQTMTPSPVAVNQPVQWQLTLRNNGASAIGQILVKDTLPPNFEYISSSIVLAPFVTQAPSAVTGANLACVPTPASITAAGQSQTLNCTVNAIGGFFPGDSNPANTMTVFISARAKVPYFAGPYLTDRTNSATIAPGKDMANNDLAIDGNPANNTATSQVQVQRSSISGRVYADSNLNRAPDGAEPGQVNVPVTLTGTDAFGSSVTLSVTTDVNGSYTFDIPPGNYTITKGANPAATLQDWTSNVPGTVPFGTSSGAVSSGTPATGAAGVPSTANQITGIQLAAGNIATNYNFGEIAGGASIGGKVFIDTNNDGLFNGAEVSIPGVTITLTGFDAGNNPVTRTVVTNAGGDYLFAGLLPGSYSVTEPAQPATANGATLPAGFSTTLNGKTTPGTGATGQGSASAPTILPSSISNIQLGSGQVSVNNNFAEILPSSIAGQVFLDPNNNGIFDAGEAPLSGVTITLTGTDDLGTVVNLSTTTTALGSYSFGNLRPGTYTVTEPAQPPATINGITTAGGVPNGGTAGVASGTSTLPSVITGIVLPQGTASTGNNFAELPDGTPDLVVAKTHAPANFSAGSSSGYYSITVRNIATAPTVGTITVVDALPAGLTLAEPASGAGWTCVGAVGASSVTCSSAATLPGGGASAVITLRVLVAPGVTNGQVLVNSAIVSGGGEPPGFQGNNKTTDPVTIAVGASLSGSVWRDFNHDRIKDAGEPSVPDWKVELYNNGILVGTTKTDASGAYSFTNLAPGSGYEVRFRDPETGFIYGKPVPNEVGTAYTNGAAGPGNLGGADNTGGVLAGLTLAPGANVVQQSLPLDPAGVVYDAVTRNPVAGAVVTISGPPGFTAADVVGGSTMLTTGANGFYQFLLLPGAPKGVYTLSVTPPGGYLPAPSALIPSCVGSLGVGALPDPALVQNLNTAPGVGAASHVGAPGACPATSAGLGAGSGTTQYYFQFTLDPSFPGGSANVVNNHIPLDPLGNTGFVLSKTGDKRVVEVGDTVLYTIVVQRTSGGTLPQVTVLDQLPAGFTLVRGTVRVNGNTAPDPAGGVGPSLAFNVGPLALNQKITLNYRVRVGVGSQQSTGINTARAHGCAAASCVDSKTMQPTANSIASNQGRYQVKVTGGVFTTEACLLGKIFVDCNNNHIQDAEELGIPGVRLYFESGGYLISDSEGKYSQCGLQPRSHVLKVDPHTLPAGARLTTSTNRNLDDAGSLFIDLKNGELHRADFVEGSCSNPVLEQVKARRAQGEARSVETEKRKGPALRFESKPSRVPQQGTDSANQPVVQPREGGGNAR